MKCSPPPPADSASKPTKLSATIRAYARLAPSRGVGRRKKNWAVTVCILSALIGCSAPKQAVGIADWDSVIRVTEDMLFRGDSASLLRHSDTSGMPDKKRSEVEAALRSWRGVPKNFKLARVEIVEAEDYKPGETMPEEIRQNFIPLRWSAAPEKFIVYHFSGSAGSTVRWSFGVFRQNGLWLFAAGYRE